MKNSLLLGFRLTNQNKLPALQLPEFRAPREGDEDLVVKRPVVSVRMLLEDGVLHLGSGHAAPRPLERLLTERLYRRPPAFSPRPSRAPVDQLIDLALDQARLFIERVTPLHEE